MFDSLNYIRIKKIDLLTELNFKGYVMAIFRILYHEDIGIVHESFKNSKVRVYPVSYSGEVISKVLGDLLKDKQCKSIYRDTTISHRITRKKEREEALEKTTIMQMQDGGIHTYYNNVRYTVFLPIHKKSTRLAYIKAPLMHLLTKAKEYNSIAISFPLYGDAFSTLKTKDILDLLVEYRDRYPAFINLYTSKKELPKIQKVLKKHNIIFDLKEIKP